MVQVKDQTELTLEERRSTLVCSPKTKPATMRVLWDDLNRLEKRIVP